MLAEKNNIENLPIVEKQQPIDITKRAINAANLNGSDVIIFDTAGRTQIDLPMMSEIKQVKAITKPIGPQPITSAVSPGIISAFSTA